MTEIVPNRIKELREYRGWTQTELANKANINYEYLNKLENHNRPLTIPMALKISKALNVTMKDIFL